MKEKYAILMADDHRIVLDGISSMLNDTPYQIENKALNGQDAYEIIKQNAAAIDVLITDLSMPILSGVELCQKVKQHYPHIKVLVLSMYSSPAVVKEVIQAEADGFMLKNAGKEELLKALHQIVNDGTYYSNELLPIIYGQIQKEKIQKQEIDMLTQREKEILLLIVKEYTSEEIADKLCISKKTVDNHRTHLLEKTNNRSTIGLVKFAINHGIAD